MKEKLRFLGLDVHAETIAAAIAEPDGEVRSLGTIPNRAESIRKLIKKLGPAEKLRACYEAGPTGYVADRLPFLPDTFDALVSRFGVMFFPSPVDAVREMLRVLKPGRKLALAAGHFAERNPFFYTPRRIVERYVDWPSPAPDAADPFRFATPGKLRDLLGEAGAMDPCERLLQFTIKHRSQLKTFGHCEARCLKNFVKRSPCFQGSS